MASLPQSSRILHRFHIVIQLVLCWNTAAWLFSVSRSPMIGQRQLTQAPTCRHVPLFARRSTPYDDDDDDDDDTYWKEDESSRRRVRYDVDMDALEEEQEDEEGPSQEPGYYNVHFEGSGEPPQLDWEQHGSSWILLPPPYVEQPRAILHFVGGTFFGSSPKLWYRTLLEGIVRATQCCIVATSIPVTLLQNPLQHIKLSRKLRRDFCSAYKDVLIDEYDEVLLAEVPIIGLGHSLGSRLLTVLSTLSENNTNLAYKAYILMSFTNYGAAASIPGVQSLLNQSKRLEEQDSGDSQQQRRRQRQRNLDYEDDDEYDEEWEALMEDLGITLKKQADRLKTALTPGSKELEFYPTPKQLWIALKDDGRYTVPHTLIVQFDEDLVDQSPRLAESIRESSDVKYARLRGMHLTPISLRGEVDQNDGLLGELPSRVWKLVRGSRSAASSRDGIREVRQSIARYITDEVAKS